jgi:hypothetical protein
MAGGILGMGYTNGVDLEITRCYSAGTISAAKPTKPIAAGIMAYDLATNQSAISKCVALNPELQLNGSIGTTPAGLFRIACNGSLSDNYGFADMEFFHDTLTAPSDIGAAAKDGAGCEEKPNQDFYTTTLGWDFDTVWVMGGEGYPALRPAAN